MTLSRDLYSQLIALANEAANRSDWATAHRYAADAVRWCREHLERRHPELANALVRLAYAESALENPPVMEVRRRVQWGFAVHLREAVSIRRKTLGKHHPAVAEALLQLATTLYQRRSFAESVQPYREYLTIVRATAGKKHPAVAATLGALAVAHHSQSEPEKAERLYRRALGIWAAYPDHPEAATTFSNYGQLRFARGDFAAAREAFGQALSIRRAALGEAPPAVVSDLLNLAAAARMMRAFRDSARLYREALALQQSMVGVAHPAIADTLHWLGLSLVADGCAEEAMEAMCAAVAVDRQCWNVVDTGSNPTERRQLAYGMIRRSQALVMLVFENFQGRPERVAEAFEALVMRKEITLTLARPTLRSAEPESALAAQAFGVTAGKGRTRPSLCRRSSRPRLRSVGGSRRAHPAVAGTRGSAGA
ncbi:tetratricopeptide repeat protein [Longimicrobium sp.]|uniref:tetratricopeptide repeat protein n=1 Tax=Longimicrobium sp. TaxID=2029185 RepID=UPI0039C95141